MAQAQAIDFQPNALEIGLMGIGGLLGLVALVCGIIVIIKMFNHQQTALGVITAILMLCSGIGHFIALIFGWMKANEWNIKKLMMGYTAAFVGSMVLGGAGYVMMLPRMMNAIQQQGIQMQQEFDQEMGDFQDLEVELGP